MQFIKLGNELINLNSVARIDLDSPVVAFYFAVPEIGIPAGDAAGGWADSTSSLEPYRITDDEDMAALRWFFTEWLPFNTNPLPSCFDVLKSHQGVLERQRRSRKEFKVGDEVWIEDRAIRQPDNTVYIIDRIEVETGKVWLHPQGEQTEADTFTTLEHLLFAYT